MTSRLAAALLVGPIGLAALAVGPGRANPGLALLVLAVLAALPRMVTRPRVVLVALVTAEASNLSGVAALHGLPGLSPLLLVLGVITIALMASQRALALTWTPVVPAVVVYVSVLGLAAVTAIDPLLSQGAVIETVKDVAFLAIVTILLVATRAVTETVVALVVTLAALSGLSVVQEFALGNASTFGGFSQVPLEADLGSTTPRHSGPLTDVNFWGRTLVLAVPLALSLACMADVGAGQGQARRLRRLGSCAALALCGGIYLTQSRGTLLALAVAVVIWALLAGAAQRRLLLFAPLLVPAALVLPGVGSRLLTLSDISAAGLSRPDPSLTGRSAAQETGLQMFLDHPVIGVGPANFEHVMPAYVAQLGVDTGGQGALAAHNLYLQMAAEGGLPLLTAWLLFYGATGFVAVRAYLWSRSRTEAAGRPTDQMLAAGVLAGLAGWATASLFLHLANFRTLAILVALAVALDIRVRSAAATATPARQL